MYLLRNDPRSRGWASSAASSSGVPEAAFSSPASREAPGDVGAGGRLATRGQQRPFPDPTPGASQLSRRRSATRSWKVGQRQSPQGSRSPRLAPLPTPPQSRRLPQTPGALAGRPSGAVSGGRGRAEPRAARPAPPRESPLPAAALEEGGAVPLGSVSASGTGRAAGSGGAEGIPRWGSGRRGRPGNSSPGEHFPPSPPGRSSGRRPGRGFGPSAGRLPSLVRGVWAVRGSGRLGPSLPSWAAVRGPGNCPAGPLASWCPSRSQFPSPPGFPEPARPGDGRDGNFGLGEGAPAQTL